MNPRLHYKRDRKHRLLQNITAAENDFTISDNPEDKRQNAPATVVRKTQFLSEMRLRD